MKDGIIIQARTGSTRLHNKILLPFYGGQRIIDILIGNNKQEARNRCQLPQDARLVLFGSVKTTDKRKGIDYLVESCALLAEKHPELKTKLGVVIFGKDREFSGYRLKK
jgi:glycosyltransferase involved in cell wall biosynthesis